jgi:hypothetical protein
LIPSIQKTGIVLKITIGQSHRIKDWGKNVGIFVNGSVLDDFYRFREFESPDENDYSGNKSVN